MSTTKQLADKLLRHIGIRQFVDFPLYALSVVRSARRNRAFRKAHPAYTVPPLRLMYDAFDHTLYHEYLETGLAHAQDLARLLKEHAGDVLTRKPVRICEWGCGPAKILRNLPAFLEDSELELHGTDYNPDTISWCRKAIPGISFIENSLAPPLPFPDSQFDVVFARSVFTHLSREMQLAWIPELLRILRNNGVLLFTTIGESFRHFLLPEEQKAFNAGEIVTKASVKEGKKFFGAIHPPAFVRNVMLRGKTSVVHVPCERAGTIGQDVWIVRK